MRETVKYGNQFNLVSLSKLTERENNLLMTIVAQIQYQGTNEVEMDDLQVAKIISPNSHMTRKDIIDMEINLWDKMSNFKVEAGDRYGESGYIRFNFLNTYRRTSEDTFSVSVSENFLPYFNDFLKSKGFTLFELPEYISISGTYTKQLYRNLKQWRQVGIFFMEIQQFRALLNVPETYNNATLTKRVIAPAVEYLQTHIDKFKDLEWCYAKGLKANKEPIPAGKGRYAKLNYVYFKWTPEIVEADQKEVQVKKMLDEALGPNSPLQSLVTYEDGEETPNEIRERKIKENRKSSLEREVERAEREKHDPFMDTPF